MQSNVGLGNDSPTWTGSATRRCGGLPVCPPRARKKVGLTLPRDRRRGGVESYGSSWTSDGRDVRVTLRKRNATFPIPRTALLSGLQPGRVPGAELPSRRLSSGCRATSRSSSPRPARHAARSSCPPKPSYPRCGPPDRVEHLLPRRTLMSWATQESQPKETYASGETEETFRPSPVGLVRLGDDV
jgi:hypothetical protein